MTSFADKVYKATLLIPRGKVTTYARIARFIGCPRAYRAVGNALHKNPDASRIPCHRVVNSQGMLAVNFGYRGARGQQERLKREGVNIADGKINLARFGFDFE